MSKKILVDLRETLKELEKQGLYKKERILASAQRVEIRLSGGQVVLNFCANNYLGLASDQRLIKAAQKTMEKWGYGLSSVRFICGTQEIHKELERKVAEFLGTEDTILYAACFDANGGVFEPLLDENCAIISDELNHVSIIDGIRLCKAMRFRYKHSDMAAMEECLEEIELEKFMRTLPLADGSFTPPFKYTLIVTDGVFSMDGDIAKLKEICDLAEKYDAYG